ncbi:MAG: hypothetical protein KC502_20940, partial [Myxococcales bacterium]|nr:hypothetical protein [Myxococcales bacterium]
MTRRTPDIAQLTSRQRAFLRRLWVVIGLCLTVLLGGCRDDFEAEVVPILEGRCANAMCHGTVQGNDAGHKLDAAKWLTFETDENGRIASPAQALASIKTKINAGENPAFSSFLRKTLPVVQGGQFHFMGKIFQSRSDPDYQTLARWVATIKDGTEGEDEPPLSPNEERFAETVYPERIDRGCA